jgi:hypothetical protein
MGMAVSRPPNPLRVIEDERGRINPKIRLVQCVAATLLHMHTADRRPFVRPLIALIERLLDGDTESISTSACRPTGTCTRSPNSIAPPLTTPTTSGRPDPP